MRSGSVMWNAHESTAVSEPNEKVGLTSPRRVWSRFVERICQYDLFLTVGFKYSLDVDRARFSTNSLLLRVNRALYGKRFKRRGLWLSGIGVLEYKLLTSRSWASPHVHLALQFPEDGRRTLDSVVQPLVKGAGRLRLPTCEPDRPFGGLISGKEFVDVQATHDQSGLIAYLVKELGPGYCRGLDAVTVFFVDVDGIALLDPKLQVHRVT